MAGPTESPATRRTEPARRGIGHAAPVVLAVVSVAALLVPWNPQGPFDARTGEPARGVALSYSLATALAEPLSAVGHVVSGAPDFRTAAISICVWVVAVAFTATLAIGIWSLRTAAPLAALHALGISAGLGALFLVYVGLAALATVPGWRLDATDSDIVLVDLQSHTLWSHDGIVSVARNLRWHSACGFDAVAITDHNTFRGAESASILARESREMPVVIRGMEVWRDGYLMLLGTGGEDWDPPDSLDATIAQAHERGMAVVSLPWKADASRIRRIAEAGVDGFELANQGHPCLPDEVRDTIVAEAGSRRVSLVASTDWHGWSGHCRAWTAVALPHWRELPRERLAASLVDALRERRTEAFQPVVVGNMGPPSTLRAVFAPFAEAVRYLGELTPSRVAGWWIWGVIFVWVNRRLSRSCRHPRTVMIAGVGAVLGCGLLLLSLRLIVTHIVIGTTSTLAPDIALQGAAIAVVAVAVASAIVWYGAASVRYGPHVARPKGAMP
jgi:predicted metal-dependent phosphoesterase TrpH